MGVDELSTPFCVSPAMIIGREKEGTLHKAVSGTGADGGPIRSSSRSSTQGVSAEAVTN